MYELQERPRPELLARVAQHALERRIQPLEVAVEAGDAEQVGREIEELAQLVIRRGHRHAASMTLCDPKQGSRGGGRWVWARRRKKHRCSMSPGMRPNVSAAASSGAAASASALRL